MVRVNYTTKGEKGKHLTYIERGKIEILLRMNIKKRVIAKEIGISERTLYREIKRGMVKDLLKSDLTFYSEYSAECSQRKYNKKQKRKQSELKIGKNHKLVSYIENSIKKEKNSPYVALENAKKANIEVMICEKPCIII